MFYRKNFFLTPWNNDPAGAKITTFYSSYKEYFIDAGERDGMHLMMSTGPIFLSNAWWFASTERVDKLKFVIEVAIDHILHLGERASDESLKRMVEQNTTLIEQLPPAELVKKIKDNKKRLGKGATLFGDEAEVRQMLSTEENNCMVQIVDHHQGREEPGASCANQ